MRKILAIGILLAVIAAAGIYLLQRPEPIPVIIHSVAEGAVEAIVANTRVGTVKACRRAYVAPAASGQLAKLNVREGDAVKKGAVLLEIWNDDLKARIALRKKEIQVKEAAARQACSIASGAERIARRTKLLQKHDGIISQEQVDDAVTVAQAKRAACQSAMAAVQVGRAALTAAKTDLERTILRAPFDGRVAEINVELGEFVTPSPPGIATLPAIYLLDISCLFISTPIDEVDVPLLRLGMPARITLDAFPKQHFPGTVTRIAPYVQEKEKQARTVEVEVTLNEQQLLKRLLPGYSADIGVILATRRKALRIPTAAILENDRVLLVGKDGLLQERVIQTGLANWDYTEVLSGLAAGDRIVLSTGRDGVEAGAYVTAEQTAQ